MHLQLSDHASKRAQQRGISHNTIALIDRLADCKRRTAGGALGVSLSAKAQRRWVHEGVPPGELDRTQGVVLIVDPRSATIITVEHGYCRRTRH